ncbi:MAG: hypothetical protein P8Y42_18825 [Exilibacterium sp.]
MLGCRYRGHSICIQVWDNGCGIAESEQSLVFDVYRRATDSKHHPRLAPRSLAADSGSPKRVKLTIVLCLSNAAQGERCLASIRCLFGSHFRV